MTTDHQNEDVHYLTVSATTNRVSGNHLGRSPPVNGLKCPCQKMRFHIFEIYGIKYKEI